MNKLNSLWINYKAEAVEAESALREEEFLFLNSEEWKREAAEEEVAESFYFSHGHEESEGLPSDEEIRRLARMDDEWSYLKCLDNY